MSWSASRRSIFPVTWVIRNDSSFFRSNGIRRCAPTRAFASTEATSGCPSTAACRQASALGRRARQWRPSRRGWPPSIRRRIEFKAGIAVPYDPLGHLAIEFRVVETLALTLTGAVLLVVCLNISGMMLVRSAMRERELSIRQAIGASRGRLARYLLSEAIVLAGLGAVLGSVVLFNAPHLLAWAGRPLPFEVEQALQIRSVHRRDLCRTVPGDQRGIRTVAGHSFQSPVIISSLKDDAGVGGFQAGRVHRVTAALQVAIAVPLIVMSGIALDRVRATATAEPRIRVRLVVRGAVDVPRCRGRECRVPTPKRPRQPREGERCRVRHCGRWPAAGFPSPAARGSRCRRTRTVPRACVIVQTTRVGDGYLNTMGIPLLVGRGFTHDDSADAEMVTVISKTLADRLAAERPRRSHRQAFDVRA